MGDNDLFFLNTIKKLSDINGFKMDPIKLATDILRLQVSFKEHEIEIVVDNIVDYIKEILSRQITGETLQSDYFNSCYYCKLESGIPDEVEQSEAAKRLGKSLKNQEKLRKKDKENLRIIYKVHNGNIIFETFGHRHDPEDIFERAEERIKLELSENLLNN